MLVASVAAAPALSRTRTVKEEFTAVVGMPDQRLGEKCCAYMELNPGETLSLEEIQTFMQKNNVAKYKWPERVEIIKQLPRTPTGKVLKYVLRDDIGKKIVTENGISE